MFFKLEFRDNTKVSNVTVTGDTVYVSFNGSNDLVPLWYLLSLDYHNKLKHFKRKILNDIPIASMVEKILKIYGNDRDRRDILNLLTNLVEIQKYVLDITKIPRKVRERPIIINNFNFLVVK